MADIGEEREVDFHTYCSTCKHWKKSDIENPCYECSMEPVRAYSKIPVRYEEKR